jgi:hypothetical protein
MLKNFHRPLYERILRHGNLLLAAGLALAVWLLAHFEDESFFITAFGFTLLALAFSLLLLAALSSTAAGAGAGAGGGKSGAVVYLVPGAQAAVQGGVGRDGDRQAWRAGNRAGDAGRGGRRMAAVSRGRAAMHAPAGGVVSAYSWWWNGANHVTRNDGMVAAITSQK